jgi:hypothetical protein
MVCTVINIIVLGSDHYNQPKSWEKAVDYINLGFTTIFFGEAVGKIYAFGWVPYIQDKWNKFDFIVVMLSIADFVFSEFTVINSNALTIAP